jgi:hypothetical protein
MFGHAPFARAANKTTAKPHSNIVDNLRYGPLTIQAAGIFGTARQAPDRGVGGLSGPCRSIVLPVTKIDG